MPGGLKPYFYAVLRFGADPEPVQQSVEALQVIGNGEHIRQNRALGAEDETVVLILGHINTNTNHSKTSSGKIYDAASTEHFAFVALFHINRLAVFN